MEFSSLPEELVLRVLSWLQHSRDIAAVGLTCRLCHRLANDKTLTLPRKRQVVVRLVGGVDVGKTALTLALKEIDATLNNRARAECLSSTPPTGSRYLLYPEIDWQRRRGLLQEARQEWPSSYWNSLYAGQWGIAADCIETPETIFCLLQQSRMGSPHITLNLNFDVTLWVVPVLNNHSLGQMTATIPHLAQGGRPVVVAVNKMDHHQVRWADTQYNQVVNRVTDSFKPRFQAVPLRMSFVPISATEKLNLYDPVPKEVCSWYSGPTLLGALKQPGPRGASGGPLLARVIHPGDDKKLVKDASDDLQPPRPGLHHICARIFSGVIGVGDEFMVLPAKVRFRVESITTFLCGKVIKVAGAGPSEHVRLLIACVKPGSPSAAVAEGDGHMADSQATELEALASAEVLMDPERSDHFVFAEEVVVSLSIDELPAHSPIFAPGSQCTFVGWSSTRACTVEKLLGEYNKDTRRRIKAAPRFIKSHSLVKAVLRLDRPICFAQSAFPPSASFSLYTGAAPSPIGLGSVTGAATGSPTASTTTRDAARWEKP